MIAILTSSLFINFSCFAPEDKFSFVLHNVTNSRVPQIHPMGLKCEKVKHTKILDMFARLVEGRATSVMGKAYENVNKTE